MIFGLTSSCCNELVMVAYTSIPDRTVAIMCTHCCAQEKTNPTPCCRAGVELHTNSWLEDTIHCSEHGCESVWSSDGTLLFMDPKWSWNEGLNV